MSAFKSLINIPFSKKSIYKVIPERVTGVDLLEKLASKTTKSIFLLGAAPGIAETTKKELEKKYESINIVGYHSGTPRKKDEKEIISMINKAKPKLLFIAYGAPKQEEWIHRNLKKLPSVKLAIGIGGSFDFISGKTKRAPLWMQKTGIEWIFRLIQEPSRISRIYNATIKFPLRVFKESLK